jgi:transcriptional regulator with XRE-family HTH domain
MKSEFNDQVLKSNFASNLRKLREKLALTQSALADQINSKYQLDIKRTSIANYENESALPRLDVLCSMSDFFGKSVDELIYKDTELLVKRFNQKRPNEKLAPQLLGNWNQADRHYYKPTKVLEDVAKIKEDIIYSSLGDYGREIADGISSRMFFIEFNRNFLKKLKELPAFKDNPACVEDLFKKTYLGTILNGNTELDRIASAVLEEPEYQVFKGIASGDISHKDLADALSISEIEVNNLFNQATHKLRQSLNKLTKL